ncbi:AraC family transcriptional regulator [Alcanivorax hongdengensis A-11-3]|uniref:AraC family transcriptional regulator n=1 Tax=Alcanivorax hongdengensis A-11-3 TaxID=1177179 RepID=L0WBP9_9GAMM|nr:AraC family transcriptional regulator [Alcanivorax hongdengensis]EKF73517.1 AraC family transcriptional regulator [Alcanivorax hongdengensis A-11-3]
MNGLQGSALSVTYVRQLADQLQDMQVDVAGWLNGHGFSLQDLEHAEKLMSWELFCPLLEQALALTGEPALGLLFGQRLRVNSHGIVGYAAMNSSSVREVLQVVSRFLPLRIGLVTMRLVEQGRYLDLRIEESRPLGALQPQVVGAIVAALKNGIDFISLGRCQLARVKFVSPPLAAGADTLLDCPVSYRQPWSGLSMLVEQADQPLSNGDPEAFRQACQLCEREMGRMRSQTSVRAQVRALMLSRQPAFPSLPETAAALHMTTRTLHRRLQEEQVTFQEILDGMRRGLAMEYLRQRDITIKELGYTLGYHDTANFRRAFKRWTGLSPLQFRQASPGRLPGP